MYHNDGACIIQAFPVADLESECTPRNVLDNLAIATNGGDGPK